MDYGPKLTEGKTKILYSDLQDPARAIMVQKDAISAGDGARRHSLAGKGALSSRTAANVFRLLNARGIPTHFADAPAEGVMIVRRCAMIPLEVVMRRLATGSYLKRVPTSVEGERFDPVLVEFFIKDDARHDPQMQPNEIVAAGVASGTALARMTDMGRKVFDVLEYAWQQQRITLVDLKIEFGRTPDGSLIVADMIDNDSWRLWPEGDKSRMLDKQIYRNMPAVEQSGLDLVKDKYREVMELTERFATL